MSGAVDDSRNASVVPAMLLAGIDSDLPARRRYGRGKLGHARAGDWTVLGQAAETYGFPDNDGRLVPLAMRRSSGARRVPPFGSGVGVHQFGAGIRRDEPVCRFPEVPAAPCIQRD